MDFKNLLEHRRSTRAYTGEPVTRAQLDAMLESMTVMNESDKPAADNADVG